MFRIAFWVPVSIMPLTDGWSGDAHRIIARIASEFLRDSGKYFVAEHLTGKDTSKVEKAMIEHSIDADSVEWSDDLHFSHTPYRACSPFEMERDCPLVGGARRCIVTAIANYTMRASDLDLSVEERGEAIKFLIHLIGDIHNPMHVGFAKDLGGNLIHLADPAGKSLHNVWDYTLVNRKQGEHGVFKMSDEEDAEPWKLSDALLQQFTGKKSWNPFMLNVKLEDVASEGSAIKVASEMASRTAMDFTCNVAYQTERNEWIRTGDSVSEEYSSSRSEAAMEMLKLAGIRLAEMLDVISHQFSVNKRAAESAKISSTGGSNLPKAENPYQALVLDFDFDPEEHLFVAEEKVDLSSNDEAKNEDPVKEISLENTKKVSKSKKSKIRKKKSKTILFEGVDLESVILIKRRGFYIVTGSQLVGSSEEYFPNRVDSFTVRFTDGNEEVLRFDLAHFPKCSHEVVTRALMKIRGVLPPTQEQLVEEDDAGSISIKPVGQRVAPILGQVVSEDETSVIFQSNSAVVRSSCSRCGVKKTAKLRKKEKDDWMQILGYVPSVEEQSEMQIRRNSHRICGTWYKNIYMYIHKDSMEEEKSRPSLINVNKFNILGHKESSEGFAVLLVDSLVFDGDLFPKFSDLLMQAARANKVSCQEGVKNRLSLEDELHDIHLFLFNRDEERGNLFRSVKFIEYNLAKGAAYSQIHWSIH